MSFKVRQQSIGTENKCNTASDPPLSVLPSLYQGTEFRLSDGQALYVGQYNERTPLFRPTKNGQGVQILFVDPTPPTHPPVRAPVHSGENLNHSKKPKLSEGLKETAPPLQVRRKRRIHRRSKKEGGQEEPDEDGWNTIDWYARLRHPRHCVMYQYDGGFAESLFSGKGLLSVRCRAPNDFSVGSSGGSGGSGGSGSHQNPGHGGRMWRPLYRGSFKDGTYEGLGHLFHIQWENYKDGADHASTDANKAEGRTGGRTSSATFVKPPQTSNVVKYRGAFVGGEMTGQGTR